MSNRRFVKVVGVRLTETLLCRLRHLAATREQRVSELCRDAIREHVERIEQSVRDDLRKMSEP